MKRVFIALLCVVLAAPLLVAQTFQGGLRGQVRDADGAVIPGVVVTLTNEGTGVTRTAVTNDRGEYVFASVPPGNYSVRSELAGFRPFSRTGITMGIQDYLLLDITLQVGAIEETVTVTGETPLIETATASVASTVDKAQLEVLPTIGRNVFIMSLTTANIVHVGDPVFVRQQDQTNASRLSLAGGPVRGNNYTLDGVTITDMRNRSVINPGFEGIEEMKVQVATYDAEMGRTGGGVFNTVHKSGSNSWTGSGLYQGRPDPSDGSFFRSQLFFERIRDAEKVEAPWQLFAGGAGGPIVRDKTFFYASAEGYKGTDLRNNDIVVPNQATAGGNFAGTGRTIFDPLNLDANGNRIPFPGNVIPANRIDPAGRNLAQQLASLGASPNCADVAPGLRNCSAVAVLDNIAWQVTGRVDHAFSDRWQLAGTYMFYKSEEPSDQFYANLLGGEEPVFGIGSVTLFRDVNVVAINNTFIPTDDSVITLRYGWTQFNDDNRQIQGAFDPTTIGFNAGFVRQLGLDRFPKIYVDGYGSADSTHGGWTTNDIKWWSQEFSGVASKFIGSHTVKAGAQFRRIGLDAFLPGYVAEFHFDPSFVSGPDPTAPTAGTGDALAALLLGTPNDRSRATIANPSQFFIDYYGGFVQDDWRVNPDLVFNFGVRLEHENGLAEKNNRIAVGFDRQAPFPVQVPGIDLRGGIIYAGTGGKTQVGDPPAVKVGPRVGFAYSINPDTVLRGGYGIFWGAYGIGPGPDEDTLGTPGFTATSQYLSSLDGGITPTPGRSLSNPYPDGLAQPTGNTLGFLTNAGGRVDVIDQFRKHPYVQRWSVDVHRELGRGVAFKVGYVGAKGTDLITAGSDGDTSTNINQLPASALALGDALNETVANPFFGNAAFGALATSPEIARGQLLRPFPQFRDVFAKQISSSRSRYDSLRLEIEKRFRGNWGGRVNYTFSRQRDSVYESNDLLTNEPFTVFRTPDGCSTGRCGNLDADFGTSRINSRHWLSWAGIYRLPTPDAGGASELVLGGWSVSLTGLLRTGFPITILQASNNLGSAFGFNHQRPNLTGSDPSVSGNVEDIVAGGGSIINPAAFSTAPAFTFGNAGMVTPDARTPKLVQWDVAFEKTTPIGGGANFHIRLEWVNIFDGVNWRGPDPRFGGANFGRITGVRGFPRVFQLILKATW